MCNISTKMCRHVDVVGNTLPSACCQMRNECHTLVLAKHESYISEYSSFVLVNE